ncbi:hypothetical protein TUM12148_33430 [Citrobacter europaeus]|nr:hypothetical protein TUM12148_33430 [Citrobacter europaeus]
MRSSQQTEAGIIRRVDGGYSSITDLLTVNEMRYYKVAIKPFTGKKVQQWERVQYIYTCVASLRANPLAPSRMTVL